MSSTVTELHPNEERLRETTGQNDPALIPPGLYSLTFKRHRLVKRFHRGVLELWFAIADFGPYFGLEFPRYYNVQLSKKGRSFTARPQSAFAVEYCAIFGKRPNFKCWPVSQFRSTYVKGVIQTGTTDYRQNDLPKAAQYSKIRELRPAQ